MSVYMTEEEQLEAIKAWWKRHRQKISVLFSVILLVIAGYRYWDWHHNKIVQQASNTYENLMVALSNNNDESVQAYANDLINSYGRTIYADVARLSLAKIHIDHNDYTKAKAELAEVASHSEAHSLRQIANIRLARLLIEEKSFEQALNQLNTVQGRTYIAVIDELRGDIYAAKGEYKLAIDAYRKAMTATGAAHAGNLFLEMKTNELAALTQSTNTSIQPVQRV